MNLDDEIYISGIRNHAIRDVIRKHYGGQDLRPLFNPQTQFELLKRRSAICEMHSKGAKPYPISCILRMPVREVRRVIVNRQTCEQPLRTTNWETFA